MGPQQVLNEQSGVSVYSGGVPTLSNQQQLSSSSSVSSIKVDNTNPYAQSAQSNDLFNKFGVYSSNTSDSIQPANVTQQAYNQPDPYQTSSANSAYSTTYHTYPVSENISYDYYSNNNQGQQPVTTGHQHEPENAWQFNSGTVANSSSIVPGNSFPTFHGHHQSMSNSMPTHQSHHQYQMILHGMQ